MVHFFSAGVPAYARIKAGATALKSNSDSYNFSAEKQSPKCTALLHCNFGGNPPAGKGRAEDTKIFRIMQIYLLNPIIFFCGCALRYPW